MIPKEVRAVIPSAAGYGGTAPCYGSKVPAQEIFLYFLPLTAPPHPHGAYGLFLSVIPVRLSPVVR